MALTPSTMMPLGTSAPDFTLPDTLSNKTLNLYQYAKDQAVVIAFICNHCPFVVHIIDSFCQCAKDYQDHNIAFIAISSNDIDAYPQDHPDKTQALAKEKDFSFPYLYDASQEIAQAYDAACTPDLYFFDQAHKLCYRGRYDATRPGQGIADGADLKAALNAYLNQTPISDAQLPSMGCNIKWKSHIQSS